jgi:hypothetical protein
MRTIFAVIVGLAVSSCGSIPAATPPTVPNEHAMKTIIDKINASLPGLKISGVSEISPLHRNDALGAIADWAICLRNDTGKGTNYFVFLIDQNEIVDSRRAIMLDRCNEQTYAPLPKPPAPKAASPEKPDTNKSGR